MVLFPSVFGPAGALSAFLLAPEKLLFLIGFLIPLILLYLIRPKPVNVAVPSLMFILKDMGKSNIHRLFRSIFRDVLFLIQLLAILLLGVALAKPFIEVERESLVKQNIIILDDSASTRAGDRFDDLRTLAIESIADQNVIILAHQNPSVLDIGGQQRLGAGDAKDLLQDAEPTDMLGDIPGALALAEQFVGPDSKVTIVSDLVLSPLEPPEQIEAKAKVLRSKGALLDVRNVTADGDNVGIIDATLDLQNASLTLKIQNFKDTPVEIGLEHNDDAVAVPRNLLEPYGKPGSLLSVTLPLGNGKNTIVLTPEDDLDTDNSYVVSIPERDRVPVLMITNDADAERSRPSVAMKAAGNEFTKVTIDYGRPPKVPDLSHQVYVIKDVSTQFILSRLISDLAEQVENGAVLIVLAQPSLFDIDWKGLLPVDRKPDAPPLTGRQEIIVNDTLGLMRGLSDIGQVNGEQLLRVRPVDGATVYAAVPTGDGPEPVFAALRVGKGAVIYYGIRDQPGADIDPQAYAILWGRIIDFSLEDPMDLNIPTGAVLRGPGRIQTPTGTRDPPVLVDRAGFYQTRDAVLAANLYGLHAGGVLDTVADSRSESAIRNAAAVDIGSIDPAQSDENAKVPRDLSIIMIIAGLCVLLFELVYIKFRGDL